MKYTPELKGKNFGRWTIIGPADNEISDYNKFRVKCKCSCGTVRDVLFRSLRSGASQSCGCYNLERSKEALTKVLPIGSTYGRWTIIGKPFKFNSTTKYPCRCECGTERDVDRYSLVTGKSMSCGCLQSKGEYLIAKWLKEHDMDFITQYQFQDCLSPKGRKLKFDFAIFNSDKELNLIIEFQGIQHYDNQYSGRFYESEEKFETMRQHDQIKLDYLINSDIPYLYINYNEIRFIPEILEKELAFID